MKKVYVKDLKIGDKVLKFDRSWLDTDFIKHKFVIKDQSTIDKIKRNGIEYVYIEPKSNEEVKVEKILQGEKEVIDEIQQEIEPSYIDIDDFNSTNEIYKESIRIVKNVLEDVRGGKMFNTGAVKNVAENITALTMRNKGILASVTKLRAHDDYTFQHSMNVSIYAASLASHLGFKENEIERIASAGLLHDVGKMLVPSNVLNKPGKLTDEEFKVMRDHVSLGNDFLKKQGLP